MAVACPIDTDRYEEISLDDCTTFDTLYPEPEYDLSEVPIDDCEGFDERFPSDRYEIEYVSLMNPPVNPLENECVCCACGCCKCLGYWTELSFSISGVAGGIGTACTDYNGSYVLTGGSGCLWGNGGPPAAPLPGDITPRALPNVVLSCEPDNLTGNYWQLVIGGMLWWSVGNSFSCECGGTLYLQTDPGACTGMPATITVAVGGTWESCGAPEPVCGAAATASDAEVAAAAATRPTPTAPSAVPVCVHLSRETERIGHRDYYTCGGGYGTRIPLATTWTGPPDARDGKVTTCYGCGTKGVWRLGKECGPACGGYEPRPPSDDDGDTSDSLSA